MPVFDILVSPMWSSFSFERVAMFEHEESVTAVLKRCYDERKRR